MVRVSQRSTALPLTRSSRINCPLLSLSPPQRLLVVIVGSSEWVESVKQSVFRRAGRERTAMGVSSRYHTQYRRHPGRDSSPGSG